MRFLRMRIFAGNRKKERAVELQQITSGWRVKVNHVHIPGFDRSFVILSPTLTEHVCVVMRFTSNLKCIFGGTSVVQGF